MAKPQFSMVSDSLDADVTTCVAHWACSGGGVSLAFETGRDAFMMDEVVKAAYLAGVKDGRAEAVKHVEDTLDHVRSCW